MMTLLIRAVLVLALALSAISVVEMLVALRWIRSRTQWYALFFPSGAFLVMALTVLADLWSLPVLGARNVLLSSITLILSAGAVVGVTLLIRLLRVQQARDDESDFLRQRYEQLFKGNDLPIIVSELESGRIVDANSAAATLFEKQVRELLAGSVSDLGLEAIAPDEEPVEAGEEQPYPSVRHRSASGAHRELVLHRSVVGIGSQGLEYDIIEDVTERNQARRTLLEQKHLLAELADHDALTGLPNRRVLDAALVHALARARRETPSALLFIDVDDFKSVNDRDGHQAGDAALRGIADLLTGGLRGEDVVARIGGDEFAILLEATPVPEAAAVARRLVERMRAAFPELGLSIGVAGLSGFADSDSVMKAADQCMYEAKRGGKNNVVVAGDGAPVAASDQPA